MVSANPNPPIGDGALFSSGPFLPDDAGKKARKPYTISKSRESWTEIEHDKFLEALHLFDRDWKKIEAFINSKTVIQIRSHAQKYFLKVQKNSTSEHVPPPRPKRKAAHPYPHKASKNVLQLSQTPVPPQSSNLFEQGYDITASPSSLIQSSSNATDASWIQGLFDPINGPFVLEGPAGSLAANDYSCTSIESPGSSKTSEVADKENNLRVVPDFAQIYSFLGSLFDPNTMDHMQKLKEMDPIDVSTVLLLMRNLTVNLTSPEFEDHRRLLSSYGNIGAQESKILPHKMLEDTEATRTPFM